MTAMEPINLFKFEPKKTYRHNRTLDTDLFIFKIIYVSQTEVKVRGAIVNRYSVSLVHQIGTFRIQLADLHNWSELRKVT